MTILNTQNYLHMTVDSEHCYPVASRELNPSFYVLAKHYDVLERKSAKCVDTGVKFLAYPKHLQCMQLMVKQYRNFPTTELDIFPIEPPMSNFTVFCEMIAMEQ